MPNDRFWRLLSGPKSVLVGAFFVAAFLLSCQSSSTGPQKPSGQQTIHPNFGINETYKIPDTAVWTFKTDSGRAVLQLVNEFYQATVNISSPLDRDTLWMDVYAAGIRELRLPYLDAGDGSPKLLKEQSWYDQVALAILKRLDSSRSAGSGIARNKGGVASVYAAMLLAGDSLAKANGFANLPKGLDSSRVIDTLLSIASKTGLPFRSYATILVSILDSSVAKARISILVKNGVIAASDSASLFPPYPVRISKSVSMDSVLLAGGPLKPVAGAFVADRGVVGISVRVYRDELDATASFELNNTLATESRPKALDLGQNLSLRASEAAAPGMYRLRIVASDDSARTALSEFVFRLAPPADVAGPRMSWISPVDGTILEFVDSTILAKIVAIDPSGVDSVWIAGSLAKKAGDTFSVQVVVPVSEAGYVLGARSVDRMGNAFSASVRLGRRDGVVRKQILSPLANSTVPFDSASVVVRWKVVDPRSRIDSVWMGAVVAVAENDSVWRARVPLAVSGAPTVVGLTAKTAKGDQVVDFISVTRGVDKAGPALSFAAPAPGAILDYDTASVVVRVRAIDPSGVDSVLIAGIKAVLSNGDWTSSVAVPVGATLQIHVSGYDKRANRTDTSISVTRKGPPDNLAPVIRLLWPSAKQGIVVPFDSSMVTLRWLVTDAFGIADTGVKIAGVSPVRAGDTFALRVALPPNGQPVSFRIDVNNIKKGTAFDAVSLARALDTAKPKVARVGVFPFVVPNDSVAVSLTWKATDNHRLGTLKFGDSTLSVKDSQYTLRVPLSLGSNFVVFKAWDSTGNLAGDSLSIVRAAPRPRHDLDSGHFVRYWKPLHFVSTGADSLQWSLDGSSWSSYKDSVRVDCDSCRILSRAWPGPSAIDTTGMFWIRKVKAVSAGGFLSQFVLENGTVWSVGKNNNGRLGDGTTEMRALPVPVLQDGTPMRDVSQAFAGGKGAIFVKRNGDVYGVGWPAAGLVDPALYELKNPIRLGGSVSKMVYYDNPMWLTAQGTVWGVYVSGGWFEDTARSYTSRQFGACKMCNPQTGILDIAETWDTQYLLDSRNGIVFAGEVYNDSLQKYEYPPPQNLVVSGVPGSIKRLESGFSGELYLINDVGDLYKTQAIVGESTRRTSSLVFTAPKAVALGMANQYVITADGRILGRGTYENGQLGNGIVSYDSSNVFIDVFSNNEKRTFRQVAAGYTHVLGLAEDGTVWAVGGNDLGQLGVGNTFDQALPVQVNF